MLSSQNQPKIYSKKKFIDFGLCSRLELVQDKQKDKAVSTPADSFEKSLEERYKEQIRALTKRQEIIEKRVEELEAKEVILERQLELLRERQDLLQKQINAIRGQDDLPHLEVQDGPYHFVNARQMHTFLARMAAGIGNVSEENLRTAEAFLDLIHRN
jgi:septal ring factor EnvC (AmiA/AmiB activator)